MKEVKTVSGSPEAREVVREMMAQVRRPQMGSEAVEATV